MASQATLEWPHRSQAKRVSKSRGVPLALAADDVARFCDLVIGTQSCAIWNGAIGSDGYGRFSLRRPYGAQRTVTPHQVAARIATGPLARGVTLLHDCDVRLCVRVGPGHLRVGTQQENTRQAVARGRMRGPRPGLVEVRGPVGQSRAIQQTLRASSDRSPVGLALVLAQVLAAGDPLRDNLTLFDVPG
jgi:hypothetical protein